MINKKITDLYIPSHLTHFVLSLQDPIQLDSDLNQEEVKNAEDNQEEWVGLLQESKVKDLTEGLLITFRLEILIISRL